MSIPIYIQFSSEKTENVQSVTKGIHVVCHLTRSLLFSLILTLINISFAFFLKPGDSGTFMDLSIFNASGEHWKFLRQIMSPTFSTGKIKTVRKT